MDKKIPAPKVWDGVIWSGVYSSFSEVSGEKGFQEFGSWAGKQLEQATQSIQKLQTTESISPLAQTTDYVLATIAAAMVNDSKAPIRILDFGGGLASTYLPLIAMLPKNCRLDFVIVENEELCSQGNQLFKEDSRISFRSDMPSGEHFDIVHAGSSMHYVDDWVGLLNRFKDLTPKYIIFTDLPAAENNSFVTIQNYYGQKIPVRFWNIQEFISAVEKIGFHLSLKSRYKNIYLDATKIFDAEHRLNYFSQLVFNRNTLDL